MEPEGWSSSSQEPATSKTRSFRPLPPILFKYPPICAYVIQVVAFHHVSPPKPCVHFFFPQKFDMPRSLYSPGLLTLIIFDKE
jgi:hypothetical protein